MDSDDEIFTVERILSHKTTKKGRFFLVKWLNYPLEESTWEPQENLFCKHIVAEYWENPRPNMSLKRLVDEAAKKQTAKANTEETCSEDTASDEVDSEARKKPKRSSGTQDRSPERFDCKAFTQLGLAASAIVVLGFLIWRADDTWYMHQYYARRFGL